ncbi:MAG: AmmeMemoRadiSam system radical SAM enzyme [Syntrophobacteraceae bacterium]
MLSRREFIRRCSTCALLCASLQPPLLASLTASAQPQSLEKGRIGRKLSPYFTPLDGRLIRCELCPRQCEVAPGERGECRVRENVDGRYYSLVYGNPCAVHVDPIEKKPFFHVLPTTTSFSLATAGCNLHCKFCQNWEISQAAPEETLNYDLTPEQVIELAAKSGCHSIASTYVEPSIFIEYMLDLGRLARGAKLLKVIHSNGFICEKPLRDLCSVLDAACIDLKGFTDAYYREMTGGSLQPVLDTLKRLKEWKVHTELVTLIVPGRNDDPDQLRAMCRWIRQELGPDVPLHFSRFYPQYKLKSLPPTPVPTLELARKIAVEEGLHYVYIGNVPGSDAEHTICPRCQVRLIERRGYQVNVKELQDGRCRKCGLSIPGIWKTA